MCRFAGIEQILIETVKRIFRHLLKEHGLSEPIDGLAQACVDGTVKAPLRVCGMAMRQGMIIDATLIARPAPPRRGRNPGEPAAKEQREEARSRGTRPRKATSGLTT